MREAGEIFLMPAHVVAWCALLLLRGFLMAYLGCVLTARMEVTARWGVGRVGDLAFQHDALGAQAWIRFGYCREQGFSVGVPGGIKQLLGHRHLDDSPHIHHGNPLADVLDNAQVVSDEEIGQSQLRLQLQH
jgi:hypothetical protein